MLCCALAFEHTSPRKTSTIKRSDESFGASPFKASSIVILQSRRQPHADAGGRCSRVWPSAWPDSPQTSVVHVAFFRRVLTRLDAAPSAKSCAPGGALLPVGCFQRTSLHQPPAKPRHHQST